MVCPVQGRSEEPIVVHVAVNSISKGDFFVVRDAQGGFWVRRSDFPALGIELPAGVTPVEIGQVPHVALGSLRGFKTVFDEKRLSLAIDSPAEALPKTSFSLAAQLPSGGVYHPRENSAFLNYALSYSRFDYSQDHPEGDSEYRLVNKLGARSGDFFFVTDTQYAKNAATSEFVRLMSSLTYENPQNLQWMTWGDQFAMSGGLGSTILIGGFGVSKVYRMNPYLIRQPTLNFSGAASLPSQVDIYVDGILAGRRNVQPGQFEIRDLNYYGGMRNVDLVIRDAFGIEQRFQYSVYFARSLLKHRLHEYSYQLGWLRENYGTRSNDYGKPAFSAFHRYGLTDRLTIGAGGEAANEVYNGSVQSAFLVPPSAGVVTIELAGSRVPGGTGWAGSVSHSYQKGKFGSSAVLTKYSPEYATIAAGLSPSNIRYSAGVEGSYQMSKGGGFSLGFSQQDADGTGKRKVGSASYSYNLTRSLTLGTVIQAIKAGRSDTDFQVYVNLNYHSQQGLRAYGEYQSTRSGNKEVVQISQDQPIGEGWGGNVFASREEKSSEATHTVNPRLQYNGRYGTYTWDSYFLESEGARRNTHTVGMAGSLVYAGGFWGVTRPVNDSFGFVMVDKLPGVPVSVNNQKIGETDQSGMLIIPTLHAYNVSNIDLTAKDIPMEYMLSGVNRKISPSLWGGACIALDAQKIRAVAGTVFIDREGEKKPLAFAEMSIRVGKQAFSYPTGRGGAFYVENVLPAEASADSPDKDSCRAIAEWRDSGGNTIKPGSYPAAVDYAGGRCEFTLTFPDTEDVITDLGDIECLDQQSAAPSAFRERPSLREQNVPPILPASSPGRKADPRSSIHSGL